MAQPASLPLAPGTEPWGPSQEQVSHGAWREPSMLCPNPNHEFCPHAAQQAENLHLGLVVASSSGSRKESCMRWEEQNPAPGMEPASVPVAGACRMLGTELEAYVRHFLQSLGLGNPRQMHLHPRTCAQGSCDVQCRPKGSNAEWPPQDTGTGGDLGTPGEAERVPGCCSCCVMGPRAVYIRRLLCNNTQ